MKTVPEILEEIRVRVRDLGSAARSFARFDADQEFQCRARMMELRTLARWIQPKSPQSKRRGGAKK